MASKSKPMDAQWEPVKAAPGLMDQLKYCAQKITVYAIANLVLFVWQQKGLLDSSAAVPAMWICALLCGVAIGRCMVRGVREC